MPWFSTLHIWEFGGQREIHRHEIDDLPTLEEAMRQEMRFGGKPNPDTLAVCKTDDADEIGIMLGKKLGLRYTIGNGIYPGEEKS